MLVMNIQCDNCGNKEECVYKNRTEELKQILEKDYNKHKEANSGYSYGYIQCQFYVSE